MGHFVRFALRRNSGVRKMAWDQPGQYVCPQDSTRSKGLSMAVLREIAVPASYYAGPGVSANFTKSRMDTIRAFPNCPSRSKSLSSLTMKSDFARSAHSRIRLSSGSSLMTLSLAVGITRFVSLANLPRESCSISPRPLELVAQHTHGFVQNGVGNVADVDAGINGGADHLARCSFRDSAIRRSMSASVFIPSAFARSRPYPMSPSRERSSKYCLTASSSSSAGSLLWARAASSNCFANSPESGRWLSTWRLRYYCRTSANRLYHRSLGEM